MTNHKERIGMIGLGIMGGAMAEALLKAGYTVTGFDVVSAAKQRLKAAGGKALANSTRVLEASDVVLVSVATSAALAQVAEQLCQAPKRPAGQRALVVETSTLPIEDKQAFAASMKRVGLDVMDCPISGTAVRMKDRSWTMFVSGSKAAYKRVEPVLRVFTDNLPYVGAFGNGSKMKFAANHLVAIYNVACAESVNLARKMGLDPKDVLALFGSSPVIGHGVMRLRVPFMIDRSYTPATMKVEVW
ncbi:MAG: NAD(P)-dependent oxidoreductase, partial [Betaproteobacteria bacterium]|nr:NAD(P)-dependent oxidoreductase [Betaproteobacteria bacterium]